MSGWVSIDDALRAAEATQEARYERPSPYVMPEGIPPDEQHPCPVLGCEVTKVAAAALDQHLARGHGCLNARDVEDLNAVVSREKELRDRIAERVARVLERSREVDDDQEASA